MEANMVQKSVENIILSGMKECPPHLQETRMATEAEVTSDLANEMSKFTAANMEDVAQLADGADASMEVVPAEVMNSSTGSGVDGGGGGSVPPVALNTGQKNKRKHRRGKPKAKNSKPYRNANWKFQKPRYRKNGSGPGAGGGSNPNGARNKLVRSRSLVPYNTNKFLMEEHLADVSIALMTPSGRTRDSSFSIDSEDNYFFSLPEDEEEFLTKEFSDVYERARVERLETMSKQQLIEECLQIEDRYSAQNVGSQKQQMMHVQKVSAEYLAKIRFLEDKLRETNRDNSELRRKLETLTNNIQQTGSSSEDSESDSSSSSSGSSSGSSYTVNRSNRKIDSEGMAKHTNGVHSPGSSGESNPASSPATNGHMDQEDQQNLLDD